MNLPELDSNDPNQSCLMAGGDCINRIVGSAVLDLQKEASKFGLAIPKIINDASKATGLHPHFLWWAFFRPKQWPPMSNKDKDLFRLAQQVFEASGAQRPRSLNPFSGNPGWTIPESDKEVRTAFDFMIKKIRSEVQKPLLRVWSRIAKKSVEAIKDKCVELYGFPCSDSDAQDLLYGDLGRMSVYQRLPGKTPNLIPILLGL